MQRETSSVSRRNLKSKGKAVIINNVTSGAVAQLGEHQAGSLRVVGSNPTGSTFCCEGGGIGIRAGFRIQSAESGCGFKSRPSHIAQW